MKDIAVNYRPDDATQIELWREAGFQADALAREIGAGKADRDEFQSKLFHDALMDVVQHYDPSHPSGASAATFGKRHIQFARFNLKREYARRNARVTWADALEPVEIDDGEFVNPIELVPGDAGAGTWAALEDAEMGALYGRILKRLPGLMPDVVEALKATGGNRAAAFEALKKSGYSGGRTAFYTEVVPAAERHMKEELADALR